LHFSRHDASTIALLVGVVTRRLADDSAPFNASRNGICARDVMVEEIGAAVKPDRSGIYERHLRSRPKCHGSFPNVAKNSK
jgi:hypothetical protein